MAIGGNIKPEGSKNIDNTKYVGLFEAKVIAVNPTFEEYKSLLGIELKDDSKACEYIGENKDGNNFIRIDFWLQDVNNESFKSKVSYFIENKIRENKDGSKFQYINNIGNCSWAEYESGLQKWFTLREYRKAYSGEEEFYTIMRSWLSKLDYKDADTLIELDPKKLFKGNVKEIKEQVDGEYCSSFIAMATIITKATDDGTTNYQGIYSKAFIPLYLYDNFSKVNYLNKLNVDLLHKKQQKDLKLHEKFIVNITGEYGSKHYFKLCKVEEYNPDDNITEYDDTVFKSDSDEEDDY